jgi:hypothetical protein
MSHRHIASRRNLGAVIVGVVCGSACLPAHALVGPITLDWIGGTSGDLAWDDGNNWFYTDADSPTPSSGTGIVAGNTPGYYPPTGGHITNIGDTTADRIITSPSYLVSLYQWHMTQSAGSTGVNALKLGGDMYIYSAYQNFSNSSGNSANMVVDLNGRTITGYLTIYQGVTLSNSGTGGAVSDIYGPVVYGGTVVEPGVNVITTGAYYGDGGPVNWMPGSQLTVRGSSFFYNYRNENPYRLQIGESGAATQGSLLLYAFFGAQSVQTDVEIMAPTGAPGNPLQIGEGTYGGTNLRVGGNSRRRGRPVLHRRRHGRRPLASQQQAHLQWQPAVRAHRLDRPPHHQRHRRLPGWRLQRRPRQHCAGAEPHHRG